MSDTAESHSRPAHLSAILDANARPRMRPTATRVTGRDGKVHIESRTQDGHTVTSSVTTDEGSLGFVVDYQPDSKIARVVDGLCIGSQDSIVDLAKLHESGITHILNVATGITESHPGVFMYKEVQIMDLEEVIITSYFDQCFQFIDDAMARKGQVLVHCNAGISRSASIVIGYLMDRLGYTYDAAHDMVKNARPNICPNRGFKEQLRSYKKK
eukprot:TRINITY_DN8609_c0_g1_i2.p1 TRINITY_DN8609_c0_g1~~TRINITY_DN8609_c0_g1_i2.p1  ORF type:complete len:220 (-),score=23.21 TRINITY_DN8609_c0_g1_i2:4-642(-)